MAYNIPMTNLARTPKQIGSIIQRARKTRGWTQSALGQQAGLRQGTISIVEAGSNTVKLNTLLSILAALDLELLIDQRRKGSAEEIEDMFTE